MNLLRSLTKISIMTLLSRILGFIRDFLIATIFGVSLATDAFFVAFKIPNLLRHIFSEGVFSQSFIPILVEYKNKRKDKFTQVFISNTLGLIIIILLLLIFLGNILSSWLIFIISPGFVNDIEKFELSVSLLKIIFPYIFFISLCSLFGAVLNTWNYFLVPAFTPVILNISIIFFILFLFPYFKIPIFSLAWGVLIGGVLQLLYQIFYLKKINMLVIPTINLNNLAVKKLFKNMIPGILGVSANQISFIINNIFSSLLVSGSISWIYYADRLMEFPSGIFGVSLGTILLSSLSKIFSSGKKKEFEKLLDWGIRLSLILAFPSAIFLGILAKPIIIIIFQYGKFSSFDVKMTQDALVAYSTGLIALILIKVLASGFYSARDIKTPMKISIFTLTITQIMNFLLIGYFKHVGLALSVSIAAWINAILLYWMLYQKNIFRLQSGWLKFLLSLITAAIIMLSILLGMLKIMPSWEIGTVFNKLFRLILVCVISGSGYLIVLSFLGVRFRRFFVKI